MTDTRPDHTEAISFIVRQHYRRVFDHARSTTERIYYKCECGAGIGGGHDWHIAREIVRALLDPSNRAVLIAALGLDDADQRLEHAQQELALARDTLARRTEALNRVRADRDEAERLRTRLGVILTTNAREAIDRGQADTDREILDLREGVAAAEAARDAAVADAANLRATLDRVNALPSVASEDVGPGQAVVLAADLTDALEGQR